MLNAGRDLKSIIKLAILEARGKRNALREAPESYALMQLSEAVDAATEQITSAIESIDDVLGDGSDFADGDQLARYVARYRDASERFTATLGSLKVLLDSLT